MKRFNFRLERLLNIKKHEEDQAKLKFASILQKKISIEKENILMEAEILKNISGDSIYIHEGELFNYNNLQLSENYIRSLKYKIKINEDRKKSLEIDLKKAKEELELATKERKKLDQLKKRKYENYKKEIKKFEAKRLDDIAGQLVERNKFK